MIDGWRRAALGLLLGACLTACGASPAGPAGGGGDDGGGDGGPGDGGGEAGGDDGGGDGGDEALPPPWDGLDWRPIEEAGDGLSDCAAEDPDCFEADIVQLSVAVRDGYVFFDLRFAGPFLEIERGIGSFEIFAFPEDSGLAGHSIRSVGGSMTFWDAECAAERKHEGCHWYAELDLPTFEPEWLGPDRFLARVSLAEWGFERLDTLLVGAGAAPFLVQRTAELTDRYPDELLVTTTAVTGLAPVSLEPGR